MPDVRRRISLLIVLAAVVLSALIAAPAPARAGSEEPAPPSTVVDNEFLPEERNLSECIGAIERPGCGSSARGGWRQWLVAVAMVGGLAFIAWRIIRSARRNRPDRDDPPAPNAGPRDGSRPGLGAKR